MISVVLMKYTFHMLKAYFIEKRNDVDRKQSNDVLIAARNDVVYYEHKYKKDIRSVVFFGGTPDGNRTDD